MIINTLLQIFLASFSMCWEVFWPLVLGFMLSAIVQTFASRKTLSKILGGDSPHQLATATLFGILSSSCSYAAVALARSLFQKGASFTAAMIFQLASTNLVIELGVILFVLMGWQFLTAELLGGVIMIIILSIIFKLTLSDKLILQAKHQADKGLQGKMEGHAAMDMSLENSKHQTIVTKMKAGFTAVSHYFVMDVVSVWIDLVLGFLIAGTLETIVPHSFWQTFFFVNNKTLATIEGPIIGPLIAIISFVCSVGNIPLAVVLWQGGISFGGVISFIFADLIILPILDIYRKYYGIKMMLYMFVTFYFTMALAGYLVEGIFSFLHLVPTNRTITIIASGIHWNYTTIVNGIFLIFAILLTYQFMKTDGPAMLSHMDKTDHTMHHH